VAVSPDGKTVVTSSADGTARVWDTFTGKPLRTLQHDSRLGGGLVWSAAFAPDGKTLALAHHNGCITFWDALQGKLTRQVKQDYCRQNYVGYSADGHWLVSNSLDGWEVSLWEAATGKEVRQLSRGRERGVMAAISPDGELVASTARGTGTLFVWEAATGKLLYQTPKVGLAVTFCPAGLLVATAGAKIQIWEAATGRELAQIKEETRLGWKSLAFSPDGRLLAFAEEDRAFLADVASGQIFHELVGHRLKLTSLAFTPDGKHLVTGSEDGTALVWDVSQGNRWKVEHEVPVPGTKDMPALWTALKTTDRLRAYPAFLRLRQTPELTTQFFRAQLQPIQAVPDERVEKLIKDLSSPAFAARSKAEEELERLGDLAEKPLRQALTRNLSVETTQRVDKLLNRLGNSPEGNRQQWALRLLEGFRTSEAKKLLAHLAEGSPSAQLTREARASLARLERRSAP
jgi:Tol biopolymer transport system component